MKNVGYAVAFMAGASYLYVMEHVRPKELALIIIV